MGRNGECLLGFGPVGRRGILGILADWKGGASKDIMVSCGFLFSYGVLFVYAQHAVPCIVLLSCGAASVIPLSPCMASQDQANELSLRSTFFLMKHEPNAREGYEDTLAVAKVPP